MPKFIEKDDCNGFDAAAKWQMIPVGGLRNIILEDGANMKVTMINPETGNDLSSNVATITELTRQDQNKREFTIMGWGKGKGQLRAVDSRNFERKAKLKLGIFEKKFTDIDFYVLSDNKRSSKANPSLFPGWLADANSLFITPQTNVTVCLKSSKTFKVDYDFGEEVDAYTLIHELKKQFSWDETYPSVIMVWKFEKKGKAYEDIDEGGFTNPPFILIEDTTYTNRVYKLLAHEISHFFIGPDHHDDQNNLLHDKFYPFGRRFTKDQMTDFNRTKAKKWIITE